MRLRRVSLFVMGALVQGAALRAQQHPNSGMKHASDMIMFHAPRWSPDGEWILVSSNLDGDTEIYLIRADGSALRQLTRNTVAENIAGWSSNGRRIVFDSERSGKAQFYSMTPDGADVRVEPRDSVVSRSPDGQTLLFESVRSERGRLFTMTAARTNVREIATARHAEQGSFSPVAPVIVFEQRDAMHEEIHKSQIVVAKPDGSDPKVITSGTDPSWSRDGRLILFKTWDDASQQLFISTIASDGSGMRGLTPGVHPHWSPDGLRIAFMRDGPEGRADVWVMNKDGGALRCVTCALTPRSAR